MSNEKILQAVIDQGITATTDQQKMRVAAKKAGVTFEQVRTLVVRSRESLKIIKDQNEQIADLQRMNAERGPVTMNEIEAQELVSFELLGLLWKRADEKCRRHCMEVFGTEQPTMEMLK